MKCSIVDCNNEAAGCIWNKVPENLLYNPVSEDGIILHGVGIYFTCTMHTERIVGPTIVNYGMRN